jgi:hypothetical protein
VKERLASVFGRWRKQPPPFRFSWVLQQELAIGPMPRTLGDWEQLRRAGIRSRFSCCYPEEEQTCVPPPTDFVEARCSLPDHRAQETMRPERLSEAISGARHLLDSHPPLYLHCWAGQERSALIAVALVSSMRALSLLDALLWVKRTHRGAAPLYAHLEMLESLLPSSQVKS